MDNKEKRSKDVDQFMAKLEPNIQKLANTIRNFLFEVEPEFEEIKKWGRPAYLMNGMVCAIDSYKNHINLGFAKGTSLSDSGNLLEGTGKNIRHIRISSIEDIQRNEVKSLIKEAIKLNKKQN
jgi:hypothetical protein